MYTHTCGSQPVVCWRRWPQATTQSAGTDRLCNVRQIWYKHFKRKTESITQHSGMAIMQYCTAKPTTYERIATVITCITSVIFSFIVVYTCANVTCIKNLRSYLLTYLLSHWQELIQANKQIDVQQPYIISSMSSPGFHKCRMCSRVHGFVEAKIYSYSRKIINRHISHLKAYSHTVTELIWTELNYLWTYLGQDCDLPVQFS